jgi:hypothetical protein
MKKLNDVVYNKLILQAEEARSQNMEKLAKGVLGSLTPNSEDDFNVTYGSYEMNDDVYSGLWRLATCIIKFHNVESADAEKINEAIESLAGKFISEIENSLGVEPKIAGPLEPKLLGQK